MVCGVIGEEGVDVCKFVLGVEVVSRSAEDAMIGFGGSFIGVSGAWFEDDIEDTSSFGTEDESDEPGNAPGICSSDSMSLLLLGNCG